MLFWPVNESTELVSGEPNLTSGTTLHECEDQSWFKVQSAPVYRFDSCTLFPRGQNVLSRKYALSRLDVLDKMRHTRVPSNASSPVLHVDSNFARVSVQLSRELGLLFKHYFTIVVLKMEVLPE
jgi:hypothetical protein